VKRLNILISPLSQTPIYEQIEMQIQELVLSGKLRNGEQLPSIRLMAKDLKVGIITVKRAYDELCAKGVAVSLAGRGVFVADIDEKRAKQIHLSMLIERLLEIKSYCDSTNISKKELEEQINSIYGGYDNVK
jgi:GntR family transcriptional regulator